MAALRSRSKRKSSRPLAAQKKRPGHAFTEPKKHGPPSRPAIPRKIPKDLAFSTPTDDKLKMLVEQNAAESPLLRLPLEIRLCILGYILGHQTIHIKGRNSWRNSLRICSRERPSHIICEATISEREAYEMSRSESYEQNALRMLHSVIPDERYCENRHRECHRRFNNTSVPRRTLDLRILRVCRRIYSEASQVLWSTTTWSFIPLGPKYAHQAYTWHAFRTTRNAFQRQMIRKVHLGDNQWGDQIRGDSDLTRDQVLKFAPWDELHIDVGLHYYNYAPRKPWPGHYFRAKKVSVICRGRLEWNTGKIISTWQERTETGEEIRLHLINAQPQVKSKVQNKML